MLTAHGTRAFCALAAAVALVAFTGCGGGDERTTTTDAAVAAYKAEAQRIFGTFTTSLRAATAQVAAAKETAGRVQGLEALKASAETAAGDFSKLDPPQNLKPDNDRLVRQFRRYAGHIDTVEQALQKDDDAAARTALPDLTRDRTAITKTIASIRSKIGG
jgi:hypothetical protein